MFKRATTKIVSITLALSMLCQIAPIGTITAFAKKETKYDYTEYQVSGSSVIIDPSKYDGDTAQKRAELAGSALFYALYDMRKGNINCHTIILKDDVYIRQSTNETVNNIHTRSVTIKGEKSGGGQVKITQGLSSNYLFRFKGATLTLENIILEGAENKGVALFIDWDNLENEDEWTKYAGGAFWGSDASFYLKNSTIQNFKKSGPIGSSFCGGLGYDISGGAAVMMFDDPQEGYSNTEYHHTFSMDANSKILNCTDLTYEYYAEGGKGGNVIHIEGKRTEESMKVNLAGEISGSDNTAIYCKLAHVTISPSSYIHDCHSEKGNGGALSLIACGLKMSGGLIENCSAKNGGAIYIDAGESNIYMGRYCYIGTHQFTGGTIQNCSAQYGGAIYVENYQIKNKLEQSQVLNDDYLYFAYDTENDTIATTEDKVIHVNLNGVNLINNTATMNGGAVMNKKGFVVLRSGTVANNTAKNGGGFYKDCNANFFLYGGTVKNNTVTGEGKDIYLDTNKFSDYNYFAFKGNFEVGSPIFVSNNNYGGNVGSYDINRIIVAGKVEKPVYFEFQEVFDGLGQLYYLMSGYNLAMGQGNNSALNNTGISANPYELTVEDFKNIVIAPVNDDLVNDYGAMFPIFIEYEEAPIKDEHHTIQGYRTTGSNKPIHISANGNDETGDGSIEKPVKTYAKAREIMGQKLIYSQSSTQTVYFYRNSVAVIGSVTPEMGVPNEMLPMLWYTFEKQNCYDYCAMGNYSREGKKIQLMLEDRDVPENSVNWLVLEGEITPTISETDFVFTMPATSVSLVADIGQVTYAKDIQLKLDVPDPDNVQETSFATIESVTVANYKGENERKLSAQEIIDTFGSDTINITWKKVVGLSKDEPFALFTLDTSFIKNGGQGYAISNDVKISVNGYESAVRVDSYEKCSVAHLVRRNNIPDLPTPEVLLTSSDDVQATNKGATNIISVTTNGIYEYTKPIKWKITEVRDDNDILQITDTEGYLPIGDNASASISKAIVSPNKIGHGEKTARIKITFEKEDGILNYKDMPDSITIDYTLAPGDMMPKVEANINFTDETVEVTKGEGLEDYVVEYMILEEGEYTKAQWSGSAVEVLETSTIDLDGYIANNGKTPNVLYIRYREIARDPGPGELKEVVIPDRPATPAMTVNYEAEKTNEVAEYPMIYGISATELTQNANFEEVALIPGTDMFFKLAPTTSSFASFIQELTVKPRPAAPVGIGINYYEEVTNKAIGEDIQYGETEEILLARETIGEGKAITLTPGVNMYFAYKSTEEDFRSEIFTLEVPNRPEKTAFTVNYKEEKTAEIIPATVMYGTSAETMDTVGTDKRLVLSPGTDVYFYKTSTASTFKSETQHLSVKSRREAPDAKGVDETIWNIGDGKIKGFDAPNEYRVMKSNGQWSDWINNDDDKTIKNLTTGTYEVRYSATSSDFISHSKTIEINYGRTITVKFDSNRGTEIESQTGLKYGDKINKPTNPEKTNCEFVKWCEDLLLLNGWDFDKDTVKDDMTLHAKWKRNKMDTPKRLNWNEQKANWASVDDEDSYTVKLYKNGALVETLTTNKSSLDMSDYLYKHGSGDYKYTVIATSSDNDIKDSDVASSDEMTYYKPPVITVQLKDWETTEGGEVRFEVGAEVDRNETLSYTWQKQEVGRLTIETWRDKFGPVYYTEKTSLKEGQYYYRCRVSDEQGNTVDTNWVILTVNKKPEVSISASKTTISTNEEVTLTAKGLYGTGTLRYEWSDENNTKSNQLKLRLKEAAKFKVTVTDERGISCTDTITITVQKTSAELVYEQFVSLDKLLMSVSKEDLTSGHVYYLMKSAIDGYEALTSAELMAFDALVEDNNMDALYEKYVDSIRQSDDFTARVKAILLDFKPATKTEVDALEKEMHELIDNGVPISTSISDEEIGLMAELNAKVADTRAVQQQVLKLVREILSQMSDEELQEYKAQMKQYMGEIPEAKKLPGFFSYLKQLIAGEAEVDFWTYIKRAFESKSAAELRMFKDALISFLQKHENKEEMINYTCETLKKAYQEKNNHDVRNATWAYNALDADEKNMIAPAVKSLLNALYTQLTANVSKDEFQAVVFEEKVEDAESTPTIEGILGLEEIYNKLTDVQKGYVQKEAIQKYEALVADKNEAQKIASNLSSIDGNSLKEMFSGDSDAINIVEKFNSLTDRQKKLIKEALGRKADNVIRSVRIIKTARSLDKVSMSTEEYANNVLQIVKDMSTLSDHAREVMTSAFGDKTLFTEINAWIKEHSFVCSASTDKTDITVTGLTKEAIADIVQVNDISEITLQVDDNTTYNAPEGEYTKKNVFSVNTRLMVTVPGDNDGYEMKDVKLKKNVQVKMRIPNNYQLESLELWNVTSDNKVELVDTEFIWNGNELYAVFLTKTFGQFILYARDIATTADIFIGDTNVTGVIGEVAVDTYYNEAKTATIRVNDKGLSATKVEYYLTTSIYNLSSIKTISKWVAYNGEFSLESNFNNIIYVKITDELGNVTYAVSRGIVIDTIAPSITGITNRNYCTSPTMTVKDTNLKTTTIDGKNIILSNGQYSIPVGTHEIVATDMVGHSSKVTVTVFDGHKPSAWQDIDGDTHRKYCEGCGAQVNKEDHKFNQEVVASKHLKKAATYDKEGTYYKSCVCGRTDNTLVKGTFKGGGLKYDGVPPTVTISVKSETNKKIKYKVEMSDGESGMYRRYHYDAGAPMDLNGILKITGWERLTLGIKTFTIKKANTKAVYIKAVDEQGNYTITDSSGKILYQYIHPK